MHGSGPLTDHGSDTEETSALGLLHTRWRREEGLFGNAEADIETRSLRSGTAKGLFLMKHLVAKIMILGQWLSGAFLDYIRPQVLLLKNQMRSGMIRNNSFIDASDNRMDSSANPRTQRAKSTATANRG